MKVQIYTLQSVDEALEVVSVGVHNIGITPASIGLPGEISYEVARDICKKVDGATKEIRGHMTSLEYLRNFNPLI
jgi:hypothetical protein